MGRCSGALGRFFEGFGSARRWPWVLGRLWEGPWIGSGRVLGRLWVFWEGSERVLGGSWGDLFKGFILYVKTFAIIFQESSPEVSASDVNSSKLQGIIATSGPTAQNCNASLPYERSGDNF